MPVVQYRKSRPVLWRLLDGMEGHQNQVIGLCEAIERLESVEHVDIRVPRELGGLWSLLPGRLNQFAELPRPDLIIGAGHGTHIPMLTLARRFGGRTVVLMKPSIPLAAFDLCLIPSNHQTLRPRRNLVMTDGAINRMRPSGALCAETGLILIGGPSKHFHWCDRKIAGQIAAVVRRETRTAWTIATSRRTPDSFSAVWQRSGLTVPLVPVHHTSPDWLPDRLSRSGTVWVSGDSVSMIFEALTAGAAVGILELDVLKPGRVTRGIHQLTSAGRVTRWSQWRTGRTLSRPARPLCESDRCAIHIVAEFLPADSHGSEFRFHCVPPSDREAGRPLIVEPGTVFG